MDLGDSSPSLPDFSKIEKQLNPSADQCNKILTDTLKDILPAGAMEALQAVMSGNVSGLIGNVLGGGAAGKAIGGAAASIMKGGNPVKAIGGAVGNLVKNSPIGGAVSKVSSLFGGKSSSKSAPASGIKAVKPSPKQQTSAKESKASNTLNNAKAKTQEKIDKLDTKIKEEKVTPPDRSTVMSPTKGKKLSQRERRFREMGQIRVGRV